MSSTESLHERYVSFKLRSKLVGKNIKICQTFLSNKLLSSLEKQLLFYEHSFWSFGPAIYRGIFYRPSLSSIEN